MHRRATIYDVENNHNNQENVNEKVINDNNRKEKRRKVLRKYLKQALIVLCAASIPSLLIWLKYALFVVGITSVFQRWSENVHQKMLFDVLATAIISLTITLILMICDAYHLTNLFGIYKDRHQQDQHSHHNNNSSLQKKIKKE